MSSALATVQPDAPALFDQQRVDLIRRTIANGAPQQEFDLFMAVCKRTGLDPISRQIYFIQRGGKWQWQTSIDGYRLTADRTGVYAGSDDAVFEDGPDGKPTKATVTVWKFVKGQRCPFTATARWGEYNAGQGMWNKMPHTMLAKCAEALALRKAFPAELSGIYTREEMDQADAPAPITPQRKAELNVVADRVVERVQAEVIEAEARPIDRTGSITEAQKARIKALLTELGRGFQHANMVAKEVANKPVVRLTQAEAEEVIHRLVAPPASTPAEPFDELVDAALERGYSEGEAVFVASMLFPDFEGGVDDWTPGQLMEAAKFFREHTREEIDATVGEG